MATKYTFGEKAKEFNAKLGKEVEVWQSPKYIEAKRKAIETLESDMYKGKLEESDFWILMNSTKSGKMAYTGLIISHNGCLKINDVLPPEKKFKPRAMSIDKEGFAGSLVFTYCEDKQGIFEVGEVSKANCSNAYPYAMALKRCMDRVILKNSKLAYSGIYSDSESEEFMPQEETKAKPKAETKTEAKATPQAKAEPQKAPEPPQAAEPNPEGNYHVVGESPRKDLVEYCSRKGLRVTEIAKTYKLNNGSSDEDFIKALVELKKTCGE